MMFADDLSIPFKSQAQALSIIDIVEDFGNVTGVFANISKWQILSLLTPEWCRDIFSAKVADLDNGADLLEKSYPLGQNF